MGNTGSSGFWTSNFPPKPTWTTADMPDLTGKITIVTGGYAGIGKETVKALLEHNAKVYLMGRSEEKAQTAIAELKKDTGKEALFIKLDLADLKSVKEAAAEYRSKEARLHILFNNGGVMIPPIEQVTKDGYDLQFGTNVLGHFYLTKLLLPTLLDTAKEAPDKKVRVVTTSSYGHVFHGLDFNTFKDGPARVKLGTQNLYAQSKFGNVVLANELARRYGDQGIVSTSCHPGSLKTELQRHVPAILGWFIETFMLYPAPFGALAQLRAGTSPEGADWNGRYLIPWGRLGEPHQGTKDEALAKELWTWLDEQVKDV